MPRSDRVLDPLDEIRHFGVDAELALLSAPFAERSHPEHRPPPGGRVLAEQGPSRISGATVDPALAVAGAEHVITDEVVAVDGLARRRRHDRNLRRDKIYC